MERAWTLPLFVLFFLAGLAWIPSAQAHASLVKTDPAPNAFLKTPPERIRLLFSEDLEPSFSGVVLLDSSGAKVEAAEILVVGQNRTIIVTGVDNLRNGVYTVSWKALSAVDGHATEGSFPLLIGNATLIKPIESKEKPLSSPDSRPSSSSPVEGLVRWANLTSQTSFVGGIVFWLAVWRPSARKLRDYSGTSIIEDASISRITFMILRISLVAALASTIALLLIQGSNLSAGGSILNAISRILLETRLGVVWIIRLSVIGALLALFLAPTHSFRVRLITGLTLGIALLLTTSLSSHSAAIPSEKPLGLASDLFHLLAVSLWVGGIINMSIILPATLRNLNSRDKGLFIAALIPNFSSIAVIGLGMIGLTGLYMSYLHLGGFDSLFTTAYGTTLRNKLLLAIIPVLLGGFSQFFIHPRTILNLTKFAEKTDALEVIQRRFRTSISIEAIFGIGILLLGGFLTATPPASLSGEQALQPLGVDEPATTPKLPVYSAVSEGVNITLQITPMQVGLNTFEVSLYGKGVPVADVKSARLEFTPLGVNVGTATAPLERPDQGIYSVAGAYFSIPGDWKVEVKVQRENAYDAIASFEVTVPFEDRFSSFKMREYELPRKDANPYALSADPNENIWFTVPNLGLLGKFDTKNLNSELFSLPGSGSLPTGIVTGLDGKMWITDPQNNRILSFDVNSKSFKAYTLPTNDAVPSQITIDQDGIIWFIEEQADSIASFSPVSESFKEYKLSTSNAGLKGIASDKGRIWFTEFRANKIGMLDTSTGKIEELKPDQFALNAPTSIVVMDDNVWITEHGANKLTRLELKSGSFQRFDIQGEFPAPFGLAIDKDKSIWFAQHLGNKIGGFSPKTKQMQHFTIPTAKSNTQWLSIDNDGNVWFAEAGANKIGVMTKTLPVPSTQAKKADDNFRQILTISAIAIAIGTIVSYFGGKRNFNERMKVLESLYTGSEKGQKS